MFKHVCTYILAAAVVIGAAGAAGAQTQTTVTSSSADDGWKVNVYPILAWVPLGIGLDVSSAAHQRRWRRRRQDHRRAV